MNFVDILMLIGDKLNVFANLKKIYIYDNSGNVLTKINIYNWLLL